MAAKEKNSSGSPHHNPTFIPFHFRKHDQQVSMNPYPSFWFSFIQACALAQTPKSGVRIKCMNEIQGFGFIDGKKPDTAKRKIDWLSFFGKEISHLLPK